MEAYPGRPWGSPRVITRLNENISRLKILTELPADPAENTLQSAVNDRRHLSIIRENEIAGNPAFLSAFTDDSLKVTAVCLEEERNGKGITIRVSSNTGDLSQLAREFGLLAKILENAAQRGDDTLTPALTKGEFTIYTRELKVGRQTHMSSSYRYYGSPANPITIAIMPRKKFKKNNWQTGSYHATQQRD